MNRLYLPKAANWQAVRAGRVQSFDVLAEFELPSPSGLDALVSDTLTINGAAGTRLCSFIGGDALADTFTCRHTDEELGITGSNPAPTLDAGACAPYGNAGGVKFNDGKYYIADDNDFLELAGNDIWIEFLCRYNAKQAILAGKYIASPAAGWYLGVLGGNQTVTLASGGTVVGITEAAAYSENSWAFCSIGIDRNEASANGGRIYHNGVQGSTGADFTSVADVTVATPFELGGFLGLYSNDTLGYLGVFSKSGWFAGGAQNLTDWLAAHKTRYATICGLLSKLNGVLTEPSTF
jgi:hypothetical protein